ncbi:hypothetical protein F5X96DRAFT_686925 [Biscogniauxia mediterranea]|nr:hypothetical protein F5X96DRAFT_686925 [Biscogniauxia mediterranea]
MALDKITNGSHPQNPLVHGCPTPLKIVIVGAGMGGMSAAIGLRRNDHQVETDAAIHLAPNANDLLRCWGIFAETFGANGNGWSNTTTTRDDKLEEFVLAKDGHRPPAVLLRASNVLNVQSEAAAGTLEDGMVVGADGVYAVNRDKVQNKYRLFSFRKAAFRFVVPKEAAEENLVTAPLVVANNTLSIWYSEKRRVVIYPCNYNLSLKFVCIHPDTESHAVQIFKIYKDFDPAVKQLISKTKDKLALIGDAAHPFTSWKCS